MEVAYEYSTDQMLPGLTDQATPGGQFGCEAQE